MVPAWLFLAQGPVARPAPERVRSIVLVYHDFVPVRGKGTVWFDCTPGEFRSQLDALRKAGATFVSVEMLVAGLKGQRQLPKRAVCLTFADGYAGFKTYAAPELEKRGIAAAMFSHTGFIGSRVGRPKLTWSDMKTLEGQGVRFYSQTVTHPADLTKLKEGALRKEFIDSRAALREKLGGSRLFLAYPNGKWDSHAARVAHQTGYAAAFTEAQRPAQTAESLWSIPRYVHTKWRQAMRDAWGI